MVRIQKGEMHMGLGYTFLSSMASRGEGALKVATPKLRHLISLYGSDLHVAATRKSDVKSLAEAAQRPLRVYASKPGSVFYPLVVNAFAAYGITFDDIKKAGGLPNIMEYGDLVRTMQDGMIDVGFFSGPVPYSLVLELEKNPGVNLLGFSDAALAKYNELLPGTGKATIRAGAYKSLKRDIQTVYLMNHLFISEDVPDDIAYQIVGVIDRNLAQLRKLFAGAGEIAMDRALQYNPIPVHPGAQKYYNEKGIK
jgi:TRAP transporter TAXI family solute receptor